MILRISKLTVRGQPLQPIKKKTMNKYAHTGTPLDTPIAVELIIELFQGKAHIQTKVIKDTVSQRHRDQGGLPAKDEWQITLALDALKALLFADNPNRGYWNFASIDTMITRVEYFRTRLTRQTSESRLA